MEPLNLNTEQPPQEPQLRLEDTAAGVPVPIETAGQRAFKARFGLSSLTMPYDEYLNGIMQGKEDQLRQKAAAEIDFQKDMKKQQIISNFAKNKGSPLTPDDSKFLDDTIRSLSDPTNPTSVFEEYYSKEFLGQLAKTGDLNKATSFLNEAAKANAPALKDAFDIGAETVASREYWLKQAQDSHNAIQDQSTIGWLADQAKFLMPGYSDTKLRGNAPDVSILSGGLLGSNLDAQAEDILRRPLSEQIRIGGPIMEKLRKDNPTAAVLFASAMLGMSSGERNLTNVLNAIDLSTLTPVVGALGRGTRAGVRGLRGTADVDALTVQTRQAVKDMVQAAADPEVSKASVITATGDAAEGGIQKATANLLKDMAGNPEPEKRAVEALPTYLRMDKQNIKENPGRLSRETQARIEAGYNNLETNIVDTITNRVQVERIPGVKASEEAIRAIHEDVKTLYPGLNNSVLDITGPFRERVSNSNVMEIHFGTLPENYFRTKRLLRLPLTITVLRTQ
jgi:hypothetical protein